MCRTFLYARVSKEDLTVDNQINQAKSLGHEIESHRIISETISGSTTATSRPLFSGLLNKLEVGDELIVTKLDRLGRDNIDVQNTVKLLVDMGVNLKVLDLPMAFNDATGALMLQIFAIFAEFERNKIIERTKAGLDRAKAQGAKLGRPLNTEIRAKVAEQQASGITQETTANILGVSISTVRRYWVKKKAT